MRHLYATTDYGGILRLVVTEREEVVDGGFMLRTELAAEHDGNDIAKAHWKAYFSGLWEDDNGDPQKGTVYNTRQEAVQAGIKMLCEKRRLKQAELDGIVKALNLLMAEQLDPAVSEGPPSLATPTPEHNV